MKKQGVMMQSRKGKVLALLLRHRNQWVDGPVIQAVDVGGSEGTRRLRELRAEGHQIQRRRHPDSERAIWQYRIIAEEPDSQQRMFLNL